MRQFGIHVDLVQAAMSDLNANIHRTEIITASNASLEAMVGDFSVGMLCRKTSVTSTAAGVFLPTNLAGINEVREADTNQLVSERGEGAAFGDEEIYRYYKDISTDAESDTTLPFVGVGAILAGGSEVVCAELLTLADTETLVGLTLIIYDTNYGKYYYEIESISDEGVNIKGNHPYAELTAAIRVRPNETSRIHFVDASEDEIVGTEFDVYYWIYPNPLKLDADVIPLIYAEALELAVIRMIPETKERRPVSTKQLDKAIKKARAKEPNQSVPSKPLSEQGNAFTMSPTGKVPYKMRGE